MAKTPNLFIIGMPKCGTTSLSARLGECGSVYQPTIKEPNYWLTKRIHLPKVSADEYFNQTAAAAACKWWLDSSVWYYRDLCALRKLAEATEDFRVILCLRPNEAFIKSLHAHCVRAGLAKPDSINNLNQRACNKYDDVIDVADYLNHIMTGDWINSIIDIVGPGRIFIYKMSDDKSEDSFNRLTQWLCVDPCAVTEGVHLNQARRIRSPIHRWVLRQLIALKWRLGIRREFGISRFFSVDDRGYHQKISLPNGIMQMCHKADEDVRTIIAQRSIPC